MLTCYNTLATKREKNHPRHRGCDYIVSNDKGFFSHDVPLVRSGEMLEILRKL